MTPERWHLITHVFHRALAQDAGDRSVFLEDACSGDDELRREVDGLLGAHQQAGRFGEVPVFSLDEIEPEPRTRRPRLVERGARISHYVLEERLGAGGMGEVFRARDLALGRDAAVKLLPQDFSARLKAQLHREAEAIARLQHPGIATFYEAGESDGLTFIAMEYVRGQTLRERLATGALTVDGSLTIAGCVLEGLAHAHAAGILHRDIKPENIMVSGPASAKLLDFGLARGLLRAGENMAYKGALLTGEGGIMGTIGYISPELLRGEPVDERSDLFAVAAVLYEMLDGRPAFPGPTATERLAAILTKDPEPLAPTRCPAALWPLLTSALSRDAARRPASARAFLGDMRRVASGKSAVGLPDTLAVLDMQNLSGHAADDWIGSGVAESVAADLTRIPGLTVLAREKTLKARAEVAAAEEVDPAAVGLRLGCRWLLAGTYERVAGRLRLESRLIEVSTGRVAARSNADGTIEGIFDLQARVAADCAAALRLAAPATKETPLPALSAYECYARGRRLLFRLEKGSLDQAADLFEQAIAIDPTYAEALAGLAAVHSMRYTFTTDPSHLVAAEECSRRAIAAAPTLAEPHVWLCYRLMREDRLVEGYEAALTALRVAPETPLAHYFAGGIKQALGYPGEGLPHFQQAVQQEPQSGFYWLGLGWSFVLLGELKEAEWSLGRAVALESQAAPTSPTGGAGFLGECCGARDVSTRRGGTAWKLSYRPSDRTISIVTPFAPSPCARSVALRSTRMTPPPHTRPSPRRYRS
jgi:TolB-like protein/Tfp pilus assembly protein PilF